MADKSYVSMEQHVCPVCCKTHDTGSILMDKHLKNRFERHTVTGWELCPECKKKYDDGYIALVEVDRSKSKDMTLQGVWRTGALAHVRVEAWNKIFSLPLPEREPGKPYELTFVEKGTIDRLHAMTPEGSKQ